MFSISRGAPGPALYSEFSGVFVLLYFVTLPFETSFQKSLGLGGIREQALKVGDSILSATRRACPRIPPSPRLFWKEGIFQNELPRDRGQNVEKCHDEYMCMRDRPIHRTQTADAHASTAGISRGATLGESLPPPPPLGVLAVASTTSSNRKRFM